MNSVKKHISISLFILGMIPFISFSQMSLNISAIDAKCNGSSNGSAAALVNGGSAPYTYTWNTSPIQNTQMASNLVAGTYKVLVTDANNVSITDSIVINQPAVLSAYIDSIIVQPCFRMGGGACGCGNTLWAVVNGGTTPYSYYWSPGGQRTDSVFNVCYVDFTVTVTDTNSCVTNASLNVIIPPSPGSTDAGINQIVDTKSKITIYPNPANSQLSVSIPEAANNMRIEIYNMLGNKVIEQKTNAAILCNIDVSTLSEGTYFLRVIDNNGQKTSRFSIDR